MGDEAKSRSARRCLFPSSDDDVPTPTLMTQSASNLLSSPQPRGGDPSPAIANSFSANDAVQEEEKEKAGANDGVQEEQEQVKKTDLPASGPESTPREKKKAVAKGKGAAGRVWSVQDEVRILERLAAFVKTHGAPPARSQLHGVVHGHLLHKKEFTKTEIYEKVRRLRDRFYAMRTKAAAAAGAAPSGDAEDLHKYELSSKIWGDSLLVFPKRKVKENNGSDQPRVRRQFEELQYMYPHLSLLVEAIAAGDRGILKRAFEFIDDGKARELNAKVKKQRILEIETERDRSSAQREVLSTLMEYMA